MHTAKEPRTFTKDTGDPRSVGHISTVNPKSRCTGFPGTALAIWLEGFEFLAQGVQASRLQPQRIPGAL